MDPTNRNTGVIEELPSPLDAVAGAESSIAYKEVLPGGDWREFLPKDESQWLGFETSACVSFSAHNVIETQINHMVKTGLLAGERLQKLKDLGFFDDTGRFNVSDRFTAKMSGTTILGNTLKAVWDSIRINGLVPEKMWPAEGVQNWNQWIAEIPQDVKNYGKKVLDILEFKYEWVVVGNCGAPNLEFLKQQLKQAPLQLAAPACPRGNSEIIPNCKVCVTQHATQLYAIDEFLEQYDSYDSFRRLLAIDYPLPYIMKGVVYLKTAPLPPAPEPFGHVFNQKMYLGQRNNQEVLWLQKAFKRLKEMGKFTPSIDVWVTGNYAQRTQLLVKEFQTQYQLASAADIAYINGRWVGAVTRAKLNELLA